MKLRHKEDNQMTYLKSSKHSLNRRKSIKTTTIHFQMPIETRFTDETILLMLTIS